MVKEYQVNPELAQIFPDNPLVIVEILDMKPNKKNLASFFKNPMVHSLFFGMPEANSDCTQSFAGYYNS